MLDSEIIIQFKDTNNNTVGTTTTVPISLTRDHIEELLRNVLLSEGVEDEDRSYTFILEDGREITDTLEAAIESSKQEYTGEIVLNILYIPISIYKIRPVTRCSSSLQGHSEAVLCLEFSPDGCYLASGSGDSTVRIWDLATETPIKTLSGHTNWVLCVSWSPDGHTLASGGMDSKVIIWDPKHNTNYILNGHTKAVTTLGWQPLHNVELGSYPWLASGSMDGNIRIWDVRSHSIVRTLSGHTKGVTQVLWSAEDQYLLFSSARDTLLKIWNTYNGILVKDLKGHGHWINTLSSSTQRVMKCGPYSPDHFQNGRPPFHDVNEMISESKKLYQAFKRESGTERLLSGSDDNTMFIWHPHTSSKPIHRLTGHQQLINHVSFSANGRYLASASFDKSIRIWCGLTGKYLRTLRGHTGRVYRLSWSCRGNLLVSASSDSTLKLWDADTGKLKFDLPGHADEVYTLDWSNCGKSVASGGKDKLVKLWCN